jgi:hypothetical protein
MGRLTLCVVCSVLVAMSVGCGEEGGSGGTAGSGGAGGSGGDGGIAGGGGEAGMGGTAGTATVALTVTATEAPNIAGGIFNGPPLEGVELCEADTTNCATTNAAGLAEIMVLANQEVTFTVSKDGFVPYVIGDVSRSDITSTWPMISDSMMAAEGERVGFAWPSDDGLVALAVLPFQAGVTWDVDDETTTVYYMDEDGVAQTDLTATTSAGSGGFYDASVGVREVEFGGTAIDCTTAIGWPGNAANHIRVPARAGHISYGSMDCDAPLLPF